MAEKLLGWHGFCGVALAVFWLHKQLLQQLPLRLSCKYHSTSAKWNQQSLLPQDHYMLSTRDCFCFSSCCSAQIWLLTQDTSYRTTLTILWQRDEDRSSIGGSVLLMQYLCIFFFSMVALVVSGVTMRSSRASDSA